MICYICGERASCLVAVSKAGIYGGNITKYEARCKEHGQTVME